MSTKILVKTFGKKNFGKNILKKKIYENTFDKKSFGKINSETKIFITKLYSNIDKYHTIFALPSIKQGGSQGVMKTSVEYDSK